MGMDFPKKLTGTPRNLSLWAKAYQFPVFYEREIVMWNKNVRYRGIPVQAYIYLNRMEYLNKLPQELTDAELMRAFTIAGILKGYTVFNTKLMDEAVKKYKITSVYDPCAGWGERMLYCYHNKIRYDGVDINENLRPGYERMMSDFQMQDQGIRFGDSAVIDLSGKVDAVITCPPYGNTEIYSTKGAENLSDDDFLAWWRRVVENSLKLSPRYFCFQVNQKWFSPMSDVVESAGFRMSERLDMKKQSSHMTRRNGKDTKREFESMLVFERI